MTKNLFRQYSTTAYLQTTTFCGMQDSIRMFIFQLRAKGAYNFIQLLELLSTKHKIHKQYKKVTSEIYHISYYITCSTKEDIQSENHLKMIEYLYLLHLKSKRIYGTSIILLYYY